MITFAVSGCSVHPDQQISCDTRHRSIFLLEAQAVPSATFVPCVEPLPAGWSYGGHLIRSGSVRFWLNSDRVGSHAVEITLTPTCDLSAAKPSSPFVYVAGLRRYEEPTSRRPYASVSYHVFPGGCVTSRLSFTRQAMPVIFDEASHALGFTPRSVYVNGVRDDEGLTLCGAEAPGCPG